MRSKYFNGTDDRVIMDMHSRGCTLAEVAIALGRTRPVVCAYARHGLGIDLKVSPGTRASRDEVAIVCRGKGGVIRR